VPVRLGVDDDAPWAVTEDVSAAGALVLSPIEIPVGTRLEGEPLGQRTGQRGSDALSGGEPTTGSGMAAWFAA